MGCRVPLGLMSYRVTVNDQGGTGDSEAVLG